MNKIFLIGNLAKDPDLSKTPNDVAVCKMSLAVNRNFKNAQGERECDFFNIIAWRQLADNCAKFLSKGKKIAVIGSLQNRSYETDNGKRYITEVMADEIEFLGSKADAGGSATTTSIDDLEPSDDNDGMPF